MRRPRIALVLPILPALLAGCDSTALEPEEVVGEWVLETINGSPLPASPWLTPGFPAFILADTLRLETDRRGSEVRVVRVDYPEPREDEVSTRTSTFTYTLVDGRIEVTLQCPPTALCAPGPHFFGELDGATLVARELGTTSELRFRRL